MIVRPPPGVNRFFADICLLGVGLKLLVPKGVIDLIVGDTGR